MTEQQKVEPIVLTEWQIEFLSNVMKVTAEQIERIGKVLIGAGLVEPPIPTDPRERALYLRKHRNTGPGKPIQEQRRKR